MIIQKYWKIIPTQFLEISWVLTPRRILRKPDFYYISSDSSMIYPEFGRILFLISLGTWKYKNIEKLSRHNFWKNHVPNLVWCAPNLVESRLNIWRILRNPDFYYIISDSGTTYPKFSRIFFLISIGTWLYKKY